MVLALTGATLFSSAGTALVTAAGAAAVKAVVTQFSHHFNDSLSDNAVCLLSDKSHWIVFNEAQTFESECVSDWIGNAADKVTDIALNTLKGTKSLLSATRGKINSLFSRKAPLPPTQTPQLDLLIVSHLKAGHGDLSGSVKLFEKVNQAHPKLAIQLAISDKLKNEPFPFNTMVARNITYFSSYAKLLNETIARLVIDYPINALIDAKDSLKAFIASSKNHLGFLEYGRKDVLKIFQNALQLLGNKRVSVHALGARDDELGLMFDEELYSFFIDPRSQLASFRLEQLRHLPEQLNEAILGAHYSSQALENFQRENWKLYFGYSTYPQIKDAFVEIISGLDFDAGAQPCFVLVGMHGLAAELYNEVGKLPFQIQRLFHQLSRFGYDEVQLYQNATQGIGGFTRIPLTNVPRNPEIARIVRIISIQIPIAHEHFRSLLMASEREVLLTGDHSLFEGWGKVFLYELWNHKIMLMQDLEGIASKVSMELMNTELSAIASTLCSLFNRQLLETDPNTREITFGSWPIREAAKAFYYLRKHPEIWDSFTQRVYAMHSGWRKIDALIESRLS